MAASTRSTKRAERKTTKLLPECVPLSAAREILVRACGLTATTHPAQLDQELLDIGQQIFDLQQLESILQSDRSALQARRKKKVARRPAPVATVKRPAGATDFWRKDFPWSEEIKNQATEVWGIDKFRMCQVSCARVLSGVCEADPERAGTRSERHAPGKGSDGRHADR